jgi:hypothetical protein
MGKRALLVLVLAILFACQATEGSVNDLEIEKINVLEREKEVFVYLKNLPRPIGFHVWVNGEDVTENCRIRFDSKILNTESILTIGLPDNILNTSNTLLINFYDGTFSKNFTETFDFIPKKWFDMNWPLTIGVIVGLIVLFFIGSQKMIKKGKTIDGITPNPITKTTTYNEMLVKTVLVLIISVGLFIYVSYHPYFQYPQLISSSWGLFYDILHYFSLGCFYVAIAGLSYHVLRFASGLERKPSADSTIKQIGTFQYYFRKILGGTDTTNERLNKEKHPSIVVISKTLLIITVFFTLRIILLLLLSTLYTYYPSNFMLVLNNEGIYTHSIYGWLGILLQILTIVFLISVAISFFVSINTIYKIYFKESEEATKIKKYKQILRIILPLIFYGLYQLTESILMNTNFQI